MLESIDKHDQWVRCSGLPADLMEVVHHLISCSAQLFCDLSVLGLEKTREDKGVHIVHRNREPVKESRNRFGDDFRVSLVPHPTFFPHVVISMLRAPVVIHEVMGNRKASEELRCDTCVPHENGCGTIAEPHLIEVSGLCLTFVRGRDENLLSFTPFHRLEGRDQSTRPTPLGCCKILDNNFVSQVQRGFYDTGTGTVGKGKCR